MDIADVCGKTTRNTVSENDVRDLGDQKRSRPVINDLTNAMDVDTTSEIVRLPDGSSICKSAMTEALQGSRLTGAIVNSYLEALCRRNGGV